MMVIPYTYHFASYESRRLCFHKNNSQDNQHQAAKFGRGQVFTENEEREDEEATVDCADGANAADEPEGKVDEDVEGDPGEAGDVAALEDEAHVFLNTCTSA